MNTQPIEVFYVDIKDVFTDYKWEHYSPMISKSDEAWNYAEKLKKEYKHSEISVVNEIVCDGKIVDYARELLIFNKMYDIISILIGED